MFYGIKNKQFQFKQILSRNDNHVDFVYLNFGFVSNLFLTAEAVLEIGFTPTTTTTLTCFVTQQFFYKIYKT